MTCRSSGRCSRRSSLPVFLWWQSKPLESRWWLVIGLGNLINFLRENRKILFERLKKKSKICFQNIINIYVAAKNIYVSWKKKLFLQNSKISFRSAFNQMSNSYRTCRRLAIILPKSLNVRISILIQKDYNTIWNTSFLILSLVV